MLTFSEKVQAYMSDLKKPPIKQPHIEVLFPFDSMTVKENMRRFYSKFFSDTNDRTYIIGINPGRIGSGTTGIPFTDGHTLQNKLRIPNTDYLSKELSAQFVQKLIEECGGAKIFYKKFFLTSVCPVGFIKNGVNFNFYDEPAFLKTVEPYIIKMFALQVEFGAKNTAIIWGKGKNYQYFKKINAEYNFFKEIIPLEHPRYLMQYKRASLTEHLLKQKLVIQNLNQD